MSRQKVEQPYKVSTKGSVQDSTSPRERAFTNCWRKRKASGGGFLLALIGTYFVHAYAYAKPLSLSLSLQANSWTELCTDSRDNVDPVHRCNHPPSVHTRPSAICISPTHFERQISPYTTFAFVFTYRGGNEGTTSLDSAWQLVKLVGESDSIEGIYTHLDEA